MVRLGLSLHDVRICKETTFVKGILNFTYKKGLSFEKLKEPDKFRASKSYRNVRKVSKTRNGNKF